LYFATRFGRADVVELLITKGANPLAKSRPDSDKTLCDVAFAENHKEVVRVLAAKGATDIPEIHLSAQGCREKRQEW